MKKQSLLYLFFKRVFDVLLSSIALIVLSPIFLTVFLMYQFGQNRGPVIYRQQRVGLNGRLFNILKFRSMVVNADQKLHENKALYALYVKNNYKLEPEQDPRITSFGRWLRKTSIDELPQFVNILKGDMSLIGPRPIVQEELAEYGDRKSIFLSVKPGAMGLWQASGRSNIGYPERCELELSYVEQASFWSDAKILVRNIVTIFKSEGAY
mgnify:FL=1